MEKLFLDYFVCFMENIKTIFIFDFEKGPTYDQIHLKNGTILTNWMLVEFNSQTILVPVVDHSFFYFS